MAPIASTTSNSAAADHSGDRRLAQFGSAAIALVAGLVLLALGIPRFDAAVVALRSDTALAALQSGVLPAPGSEQLTAAADAAVRSLRLAQEPETAAMLGRLRFAEALAVGANLPAGQSALAQSRDATRRALMLAPGSPFEWLQLAYENFLTPGGAASGLASLRMSVHTGRYTYRLLFKRLDLALQFWPALDPQLRQEFEDQVRAGARANVYYLVTLAWHHHRVSEVRHMLASQPEELPMFEKDLIWQGPGDYAVIRNAP